ncbi:hypothetical protein [Henriciella litoralis]|uniref:hypothetical protein n=1 Tax=Henriciella litoralis TaxID=568102 RepID=UPI001F1C1124|nr:hypothetical protein [Henriciella litoralis]
MFRKEGQDVKNACLTQKTPDAGEASGVCQRQILEGYLPLGLPGAEGLPGLAAGLTAGFDAGFAVCDFIALLSDGQCRLCPQTSKRHAPASLKYVVFRRRAIPAQVNILLVGHRQAKHLRRGSADAPA